MTLRAFLIGLVCVAVLCLVDPYTSFNRGYAWNTSGHFPQGAVFPLILFTIVLSILLKLLRRNWGLKQAELMLIWCMLIVASVVPSAGLQCHWLGVLAGPAYVARRPDIPWKDTSLEEAPGALLLSKHPNSPAARHYFEGSGEEGRVPWREWLMPLSRWGLFMAFYFGAVFFLCGVLRKQWVDVERLQFPLARVPLEFTEGSEDPSLLPRLFANRAFVRGLAVAAAFRFVRALPLLFGGGRAWYPVIPFRDALSQTPLEHLYLDNADVWWSAIGFAYLVPADVSLSIWLFYLFGRVELFTASRLGSPLHYGGTWSELMRWQMAGSYIVFTLGAVVMARRHLADVFAKATWLKRGVDDSQEPVSYRASFWGFLICGAAAIAWLHSYGMQVWVGAAMLFLWLCIMMVHARLVAQSGMYITEVRVQSPTVLHGLTVGHAFTPPGAVVAQMHQAFLMEGNTSLLSPAAIHAFRIGEVFQKRRRLLLPVLGLALLVALVCSSWTSVVQAYSTGALNFSYQWGITDNAKWVFDVAHLRMEMGSRFEPARWTPFSLGAALTAFVMFMRARFHWWPVHPIGLLGISGWHIDRLWVPFLLGWLTKVGLLRFGSGRLVHQARLFFIALIMLESFVGGVSMTITALSGARVPAF